MARQVLSAPYRVDVDYTVSGFTHKFSFFTSAFASVLDTSGYFLDKNNVPAGIPFTAAVASVVGLLKPFFHTSVVFGSGVLLQRVGNTFNPVAAVASGESGTSDNPPETCTQVTLSFKSSDNDPMRLVILEQSARGPYRSRGNLAPANYFGAIVQAMVNPASDGLGLFAKSRSGQYPARHIASTISLNRRLRRRRGLA